MLEFRPGCECCGIDLLADRDIGWICSLECTFCADCAQRKLEGVCPNCTGELTPRPRRAQWLWEKFPVSSRRIHQPGHCDAAMAKRKEES